jgi:hypothetical protein
MKYLTVIAYRPIEKWRFERTGDFDRLLIETRTFLKAAIFGPIFFAMVRDFWNHIEGAGFFESRMTR